MVSKLNGDEGVAFLVRDTAQKVKEAPGPAYEERGGVRWLGTDAAMENRGGVRWGATAYWRKVSRRSHAGTCKERGRQVMA
jgi:hypothetical protein